MFYVYAGRHTLHKAEGSPCPWRRFIKGCSFACVLLLIFWGMIATSLAQGIERNSMAGESEAEASHNSNLGAQPYNLQLGPVNLRVDAGSSVMYNDNINLANSGKQEDIILSPSIGIHGQWQATELNALTFDIGVSYLKYLTHSNYDNFLIAPNSQTQFKIFIGDFTITLYDSFSYQQDPVQVGQLSNISQFDRFTNDAGFIVNWDLADLIVSLEYDHNNFLVFQQAYTYLDYQSDAVSPKVTFKLNKTMEAGLSASVSAIRYDQDIQNNYTQFQAGPFITDEVSDNLSLQAQIGWDYTKFAQGGLNGDTTQSVSSPYGNAGITHRVNDALKESLTVGREFLPGITSNYTDRIYANYTPTWHATSLFDIAPQLWWENLNDSAATVRETSNRFGLNFNIYLAVTQHASVNLGYSYVIKRSDQTSLNYYQDVITLGLNYQF